MNQQPQIQPLVAAPAPGSKTTKKIAGQKRKNENADPKPPVKKRSVISQIFSAKNANPPTYNYPQPNAPQNHGALSERRMTMNTAQTPKQSIRPTLQPKQSIKPNNQPKQSMLVAQAQMQAETTKIQAENFRITQELSSMKTLLEMKQLELSETKRQLDEKQNEVHELMLAKIRQESEASLTISVLRQDLDNTKKELEFKRKDLLEKQEAVMKLEIQCKQLEDKIKMYDERMTRLERENEMDHKIIGELQVKTKDQAELIEKYERKMKEDEILRRKLHNEIIELKGNIRVFCRIRPLVGDEINKQENNVPFFQFSQTREFEKETIKILEPTVPIQEKTNASKTMMKTEKDILNAKENIFSFDKIFKQDSKQDVVFEEISQLVQSALDGYQVTIFACGPTGSGKTYTMEGGDDEDTKGMIPRSVEKIFEVKQDMETQGWKYEVSVQFVEIYNEKVRDLLSPADNQNLEIKFDQKDNDTRVVGAQVKIVRGPSEVRNLLKLAQKNRVVGRTDSNESSSRSHSVFTLKINGKMGGNTDGSSAQETLGVLNLVDLAGSERVKKSNSQGKTLIEASHINSSLFFLRSVIASLSKGEKVNYRDSKLTQLLQGSLGNGNSKTLMFANISPTQDNLHDTKFCLQFACTVNGAHIGTAKQKVQIDGGKKNGSKK